MESIGEKLKKAREEKGYTIEQIARSTNISKRFIAALENEEFELIPGETYLYGFLKNYAEYLELDSDKCIALYRNLKIQEQPIPMEDLVVKKQGRGKIILIVLIGLVAAAGIVFGIWQWFIPWLNDPARAQAPQLKPSPVQTPASTENKKGQNDPETDKISTEDRKDLIRQGIYPLDGNELRRRFAVDEIVLLSLSSGDHQIKINKIAADVSVLIKDEEKKLGLGNEASFDIDGDGQIDVIISVYDIDSASEIPTASILFKKPGETALLKEPGRENAAEEAGRLVVSQLGQPSSKARQRKTNLITEKKKAEVFNIYVRFREDCLFRYTLNADSREEKFFRKGETFRADVEKSIRLFFSNAGAASVRIAGKEVDLGNPGQVSVSLVKWNRDAQGNNYRLEQIPMY